MSMIGKTLGHYQIASQLGKGGMGEVYQAKDQTLGRDVAIKVLPDEFAKDADRVARFQREAKLLASLNHPNIAAIYGLEESGGTNFLVLELVEGETLADRIKAGPIPVEESLKLALQIAEALEAAHEKGVIHRDLKPANIKVTPDGTVKVLDFGLAKAFAGDQAELNLSNSPTLSDAATQQGVILGTAAYMPPEQAKGKAVDKRADIWAFGVVLFEMLTGRQLFTGETISETLAAVLMREPEFSKLPPNLHPRILLLLERCLEREPKNRYHDIADVRVDIQKALADPSGVLVQPVTTAVEPRKKLRVGFSWVAAALVLGLIIAGVAVWKLKPSEPHRITRFSYELPKDQELDNASERAIAVSPDGRQFVYSTPAGLYLRSMEEMDAKLLPGTPGNRQRPFFSPDGKWIGFFSSADNKLKKIATSGGASVTLADANPTGYFDWSEDDTIVYGQMGKGILRVSANGGTPEQIIKPAENETYLISPQILPDGKSLLFTHVITTTQFKIMVQSLKSGERKELFEGDTTRYLPTGHIVYGLGNNLFAVRFDINALKMIGGPVPVVESVLRTLVPQYAISDSGTLVYVPGTETGSAPFQRTLVWVDRNGKEEPLAAPLNAYFNPRLSTDGTKVALRVAAAAVGNSDIWIWDLVHKTLTRLTFEGINATPLWTPDGKRIAFFSSREGKSSIYWKSADGAGKDELLGSVPGGKPSFPASWSDNGKTLVLAEFKDMRFDIGMLSMERDHTWKSLLSEKYHEAQPQISPDGRWMVYTSNESGQNQIYVRPFPDVNSGRWQISTNGGDSPLWSKNGKELFYRNGDAVMAVPVKTVPTFSLETPRTLFRGTYVSNVFMAGNWDFVTWDVSPDGKRFLMMKEAGSTASGGGGSRKISIVLNWTEELKQRVP
jgi:serine/threonine-protein kinase